MDKRELIRRIIEKLLEELDAHTRAAQAAHAEATDEQNKAENKYDTRGLEASYLARGQSRQIAEIEVALQTFQKMEPRDFTPTDPIDVGALVELEEKGERMFFFLAPRAGGAEVQIADREILVITPQSPLGQELVGKKSGQKFDLKAPETIRKYRILDVK